MKTSISIASTWGSTASERVMPFPCDRYLSNPDDTYFRAVDIQAPTHIAFRWLCQLRIAPYSYDWIDNFGRRSPHNLIPGLERLEVDQRVMSIFKLVEFETNQHLTIVMSSPQATAVFGEVAGSYVICPQTEQSCRLVAKLLVRYPKRGLWKAMRWFLPWGDLIMMRKQLLTLKQLAEGKE